MLRSDPAALQSDFALGIIAALHGGAQPRELQTGCFEIAHFGSSGWLQEYDHWPELAGLNCYGVADSLSQLLTIAKEEVVDGPRIFLITITPIHKRDQPEEGGWRWKKWGPYIGTQRRSGCEYLAQEVEIETVCCYHIYEKKSGSTS